MGKNKTNSGAFSRQYFSRFVQATRINENSSTKINCVEIITPLLPVKDKSDFIYHPIKYKRMNRIVQRK